MGSDRPVGPFITSGLELLDFHDGHKGFGQPAASLVNLDELIDVAQFSRAPGVDHLGFVGIDERVATSVIRLVALLLADLFKLAAVDEFATGSRRFDLWILVALALLITLASPRLVVYSKMRHPQPTAERTSEEPTAGGAGVTP